MKEQQKVNYYSDCIKTSLKVNVTIRDVHGNTSLKTQGLWDTGAVCSAITASAAKDLRLKPFGQTPVITAGGRIMANRYLIRMEIEGLEHEFYVPAVECAELSDGGTLGLSIGMDIISKGDFVVSNQDGKTSLSFRVPAGERIEF